MAKLRRDNHYVPGCYQKGFADSSGLVWVKRAGKDPVQRNPRSVGKKLNLYVRNRRGIENDDVECFFGENVENQLAVLVRRVKAERNKLPAISAQERGALAVFVVTQAFRTPAHKQCISEQVGRPVDGDTFLRESLRQMWTILKEWRASAQTFHFYTPLPHVGGYYITGDHPVLAVRVNTSGSPIKLFRDEPRERIMNLAEFLASPQHEFTISLSPYVRVSIHAQGDGESHLPPTTEDPRHVRYFNDLIRGQCKFFILARDRDSLI